MARQVKLFQRLQKVPKDFTWSELFALMKSLGFVEVSMGRTSGSRVRFISDDHLPLVLHKPHPKPILKRYQVKQIIEYLKKEGLL